MTTDEDTARVEHLLRDVLAPLADDPPAVPAALTRTAVHRGGRVRRWRRAAMTAVPVLAATVVVATVLSVQAGAPEPVVTGPAGGKDARGWQLAATSPLSPRTSPVMVAVGAQVLVFGGSNDPPCHPTAFCVAPPGPVLLDGAAYDRDRDTWRRLASAPVPLLYASAVATGGAVYVLTPPPGNNGGAQQLLEYSVTQDRWTVLPAPPVPLDRIVAAGGDRLAGYVHQQKKATPADQLYDVATRTWTAMPRDPLAPTRDRNLVTTDSGDLVLVGVARGRLSAASPDARWQAAVWNAKTSSWRELPRSRIIDSEPAWYWVGGLLVNPDTTIVEAGVPAGGTLDPATGTWRKVPARSSAHQRMPFEPAAGGDQVVYAGQVLNVATGTWASIPAVPAAFPSQDVAPVIAGDRLITFGGASFTGYKGTLSNATWVLRLPG